MVTFDLYNKQISYYYAPKCGSRTILAWAALLKNPSLFVERPDWFSNSRMDDYKDLGELVTDRGHQSSQIKFCVVRDPVDRFVSAYTNRVLYHGKTNHPMSISSMIEGIEQGTFYNEDVMAHLDGLTTWYGEEVNNFTHIFNLKQMGNVKKLLETISDQSLPDIQLQQSGGNKKPTLTSKQMEWVRDRYKKDYEIFGKYFTS